MSGAELDPSHLEIARNVHALLGPMAGELDVTANPDRAALRYLGVDAAGWIKTPYHPEAFKIWGDALRRKPDDIETLHHLAIMHHARAFDVEAGAEPTQSNADWEAALQYWHRLWQADAFWSRVADIACKGTRRDPVDVVRSEFPQRLLQVHFDIAFDKETTKNHRAKFHIDLALKSPFPRESLEAVRTATYDRMIERVPKNVWNPETRDPKTIELGAEAIQGYLKLDPGCVRALADAVRLQERLLHAKFEDWIALDDAGQKRREHLLDLKRRSDVWRPYFDRLIPEQLDEVARSKLGEWYSGMGIVLRQIGEPAQAVEMFERAIKAGGGAELIREYGNLEALKLSVKGMAAFQAGRHQEAIDCLRRALGVSGQAHMVRRELSHALTQTAILEHNKRGPIRRDPRLRLLGESSDANVRALHRLLGDDSTTDTEEQLREALELDPSNEAARDALETLQAS